MKKIFSLMICLIFLCESTSALALSETIKENVYTLAFSKTSGSGYSESYWIDENGERVTLYNKDAAEKSSSFSKRETLPSYYNSAQQGVVTTVKDQGVTGSCWAFSEISAAESSLIKRSVVQTEDIDLSEAHHVWFTHNCLVNDENDMTSGDGVNVSSPYYSGGNWLRSTFSLARGMGFAYENDYPFYPDNVAAMGNYGQQDRYVSEFTLSSSYTIPETNIQAIKQTIISNGCVTAAFYMANKYLNKTVGNFCYYCPEEYATNHQITIVGWDNDYSASNFKDGYQPNASGAWIVKNSYGSSWGNNGYFYLSFYDASLANFNAVEVENAGTYDELYQYDGYGYGTSVSATSSNGEPIKTASFANVFTSKDNEEIKSVSFYTVSENVSYTVEIYTSLPANYATPTNNGVLALRQSGTLDYSGYYKIDLSEKVNVKKGEIFSVVVTLTSEDGILIVLEGASGQNDGSYTRYYSSKPKQSYFRFGTTSSWQDSNSKGYNNACVKAFASTPDVLEIGNAQELCAFSQSVNSGKTYKDKTVKLTDDIDMTGVSFTPIGTADKCFDGVFDGNGKIISNLNISVQNNAGLFGTVGSNGIIKLVGLENASVTGAQNVGALIGLSYAKKIYNCYSCGEVSGETNVGGLVGYNLSAVTDNCFSTSDVEAQNNFGALVGFDGSSYENCFAKDNISPSGNTSIEGAVNCVSAEEFANGFVSYMLTSNAVVWTKGENHPTFSADENARVHLATVYIVTTSSFARIYLSAYEDLKELLEERFEGFECEIFTDYSCTNAFAGAVTFDRTLFAKISELKHLELINNSDYLIESSLLCGVKQGTSVTSVLSCFKNKNAYITDINGDNMNENEIVSTLCKVCLPNGSGGVLQEITVVVAGDFNSDGFADSFDLSIMFSAVNFEIEFSQNGALEKAGDLNKDGYIDAFDASLMCAAVNFETEL